LSEEDAQAEAIRLLQALRYGDDNQGYFWISDFHPYMIMYPNNISLQGKDLSNYADPNGKKLYVEMVDVCEKQGEGFVNYRWQYGSDTNRLEPVISYVKTYQPWQWIVGTGLYTVDIQQVVDATRNQYLLVMGVLTLICIVLIFIIRTITSNIKKIAVVANRLALGDTKQKINIKSNDETGEMANALTKVIYYLWEISEAAEKIASGDMTVEVQPKSEKDTLGISFGKMVDNLRGRSKELRQKVEYLNQIPTTILTVDKDYNILFLNKTGVRIVGKPLEDCLGKKCYDLFDTDDCNTEKCAVRQAFAKNKVITVETNVRLPSGVIPVRYTGSPIRDTDGNVIAATEYVLDLVKKRQLLQE
jgi:methyl-accepting chemotaxis protein